MVSWMGKIDWVDEEEDAKDLADDKGGGDDERQWADKGEVHAGIREREEEHADLDRHLHRGGSEDDPRRAFTVKAGYPLRSTATLRACSNACSGACACRPINSSSWELSPSSSPHSRQAKQPSRLRTAAETRRESSVHVTPASQRVPAARCGAGREEGSDEAQRARPQSVQRCEAVGS